MNSGKGGNNPLPFSLPLTLAIMGPKRIRYLILTSIVIGPSLLYYHFGFRIWDFEFKDPQSARPTFVGAPNPQSKGARVIKVIDGDTIEIEGGKLVRYIGINAPEMDMPFYKEATQKNKTLVEGKRIRLEVCKPEPRDRHGRILAWVYTDNTLVNAELLKEGLARTFIIPPCGLERADEFKRLQDETRRKGLGIWATWERDIIPADQAHRFIGQTRWVRGKVVNTYDSGKAIFLNFGADYKKDFTIVIFSHDLRYFERARIDPGRFYKGKEVLVYGRIREHNGPEVVVETPWEIEIR